MLLTRPRRLLRALIAFVAVGLLAGCQVDVAVEVEVADDGSGTVTVAVGLDDDALARVPDLATQLRVDDLEAAGWKVSAPKKEGDRTWVRATKPFEDSSQLTAVMSELTGADGPFRDFELEREHSFGATDYRVRGVVDLRKGLEAFGDDELAEVLDGDMFGGNLQRIEAEEGRPASEMVSVAVTLDIPGATEEVFKPTFADDQPTKIDIVGSVQDAAPRLWIYVAVAAFVLAALVPVRAAFKRRTR